MNSLLRAREGGLASDATGEFSLFVGRGALNVDTMVTILRADDVPAEGGYEVLRTWRVDAYPAPVELNAKCSLSHRAVAGVPEDKFQLFIRPGDPGGPIPTDGWQSLRPTPLGDWLSGKVWFLPPSSGSPPRSPFSYVCLVRRP